MSAPAPWKSLRAWLRARFFATWRRTLATDDGRRAVAQALGDSLAWRPAECRTLTNTPLPYDLGRAPAPRRSPADRPDPIFVTARFRSGSTLVWNLFRHVPGCTAYYEPLNERRWFLPEARGARVDATHRQVSDYWREYAGMEDLDSLWRDEWTSRGLYMGADAWDPRLADYVQALIDRAPGRAVLQFNRVGFRLGWLRRNFPHARILHLFRHPRDQWISALGKDHACTRDTTPAQFPPDDRFYLFTWLEDLKYRFPFLDPAGHAHPYEGYYLLWKLSWLFGRHHADHSLRFEDLQTEPARALEDAFAALGIEPPDLDVLLPLIEPVERGKWKAFADDAWFAAIESRCERVLDDFLAPGATSPPRDLEPRRSPAERRSPVPGTAGT